MSQSGKFVAPLAVAVALLTAFGLTLAHSDAAQHGVQPAGAPQTVHPTFDRAPNLGTQRSVGVANNLNKNRNISKGISPDG